MAIGVASTVPRSNKWGSTAVVEGDVDLSGEQTAEKKYDGGAWGLENAMHEGRFERREYEAYD